MSLVPLVSAWAEAQTMPLQNLITDAEAELTAAERDATDLREDLTAMRRRLVLDKLDRKELASNRKRINDLELKIEDLRIGIAEARKDLVNPPGKKVNSLMTQIFRTATAIRDCRATVLSAFESDRPLPSFTVQQVHVEVASLSTSLDALESVMGDAITPDIEKLIADLRRTCSLISREMPSNSRVAA